MPRRQRNYAAEYQRRKARAEAQGTTYGRIKYAQDKARAKREGYPSPVRRARARRNERLRDERIEGISRQIGVPFEGLPSGAEFDQMIRDMIDDWDIVHDREWWDAFRAWYGRVSG